MEIFLWTCFLFSLAFVIYWWKKCALSTGNLPFGGLPWNREVRTTFCLDMILANDCVCSSLNISTHIKCEVLFVGQRQKVKH